MADNPWQETTGRDYRTNLQLLRKKLASKSTSELHGQREPDARKKAADEAVDAVDEAGQMESRSAQLSTGSQASAADVSDVKLSEESLPSDKTAEVSDVAERSPPTPPRSHPVVVVPSPAQATVSPLPSTSTPVHAHPVVVHDVFPPAIMLPQPSPSAITSAAVRAVPQAPITPVPQLPRLDAFHAKPSSQAVDKPKGLPQFGNLSVLALEKKVLCPSWFCGTLLSSRCHVVSVVITVVGVLYYVVYVSVKSGETACPR